MTAYYIEGCFIDINQYFPVRVSVLLDFDFLLSNRFYSARINSIGKPKVKTVPTVPRQKVSKCVYIFLRFQSKEDPRKNRLPNGGNHSLKKDRCFVKTYGES